MTRIVSAYNNFARGKIDHDMQGRFDLPIYRSGLDVCTNFVTNFKGNAKYRPGFANEITFQDCAFKKFRFSNNQNYILVFYDTKLRFLSYDVNGVFGWVLDGGMNILEIDTPYTLEQAKELSVRKTTAQNRDVLYIVHEDHEPRKLTRLAANDFTLTTFSRKADPFVTTYAATQNITGITQATNPQVTINAHGYSVGDRFRITGVGGMTEINDWTVSVVSVVDVNNVTIDLDTTDFTAYTSGGTAELATAGDYPFTVAFYKGRLYYASTPTRFTTVWGSAAASFDDFEIPDTVDDDDALQFTIAEISERIQWLWPGDNSLIVGAADGIVAVNGGSVNDPIAADTIEASLTSADGCNETTPLTKDGLVFYANRIERNLYYFNYDLLTESFQALDANLIAYDITEGLIKKQEYIKDIDDLIWVLMDDGNLLALNFLNSAGQQENIIGWTLHTTEGTIQDVVEITDNDGNPRLFILAERNGAFYIERLTNFVEFAELDEFFTGDRDADRNAYNRSVGEQLKAATHVDNAEVIQNLQEGNTITYDPGAGTITASSPVFASGDVDKQIAYRTQTGYESGRFLITGFTSSTVVDVTVIQTPTTNTYSDWYLSFDTLTGLSRFNGQEVAVVTDGGFLLRETVSGGEINLTRQVTYAVVGYDYRGTMKTFSLGVQVQARNTQTTAKGITRVGVRTNASVGGKIGGSQYRLEDVQELGQNDLNYLPPLPIDGTKYVTYGADFERDKYFYMIQDDPGPFHVTALMVDADQTID